MRTESIRKGRNAIHLTDESGDYFPYDSSLPRFTVTLCGRAIDHSTWRLIDESATCSRCEAIYSERLDVALSLPVQTHREHATDADAYSLVTDDGTVLGTVRSTLDRTGDWKATKAKGEITSPRFSDPAGADEYLRTGTLPVFCPGNWGALGACIRERGHYGVCVAAFGHRFSPVYGWVGHGACECVAYPDVHPVHCSDCSARQDECVCQDDEAAQRPDTWIDANDDDTDSLTDALSGLSWEQRARADAGVPVDSAWPERDDDTTDDTDDVAGWRDLRGHYVATARRYLRDAQTLRGYGDRSAVLGCLRNARMYRQAAASVSRTLTLAEAGESTW